MMNKKVSEKSIFMISEKLSRSDLISLMLYYKMSYHLRRADIGFWGFCLELIGSKQAFLLCPVEKQNWSLSNFKRCLLNKGLSRLIWNKLRTKAPYWFWWNPHHLSMQSMCKAVLTLNGVSIFVSAYSRFNIRI